MKKKNEVATIDECAYLILQKQDKSDNGFTVIEKSDLALAGGTRWYRTNDGKGYARTAIKNDDGTRKLLGLHQLICPSPDASLTPDHLNRNSLDNRRVNLRLATKTEQSQNSENRSDRKDNNSGIKGVSWHEHTNKWEARIVINGKQIYLGIFPDILEASAAYQTALANVPPHDIPEPPAPYPDPWIISADRLAIFRACGGNILKVDGEFKVSGVAKHNEELLVGLRDVKPFVTMLVDKELETF